MIIQKRRLEAELDQKTTLSEEGLKIIKRRRLEAKHEKTTPSEESLKMTPEGEDAHFLFPEKLAIGVADGVGGWAKKGIDAGEYARELMNNAFIAIDQLPDGVVDPTWVINEAFLNTKAPGSSTACILMLEGNILRSFNVGDSGFMIFRENKLLYQSPIQQRRFNCPYQLGNSEKSDRPSSGRETIVEVVAGDIIVLGTDGLLDNVYPEEIENVLEQATLEGLTLNPRQLAFTIAIDLAMCNSEAECIYSPFARAAELAGQSYIGGKIDDITVVVAKIVPQN